MKLAKKRTRHAPGNNMTPMIDITFLLLIFFITVTQVSETNREQVQLPELAGEKDQQRSTITVNVNSEGTILVGGNQIDIGDLAFLVSEELAQVAGNAALVTVVVRIDQNSPCGPVNRITQQLRRSGISQVRFAVQVPR